jgi:hypothetical protein
MTFICLEFSIWFSAHLKNIFAMTYKVINDLTSQSLPYLISYFTSHCSGFCPLMSLKIANCTRFSFWLNDLPQDIHDSLIKYCLLIEAFLKHHIEYFIKVAIPWFA